MPRRKLTDEQVAQAFEMRERGLSYYRIARRFGVSEGAIAWHCLNQGVESPRIYRGTGGARPGAVEKRGDHLVRRFTPEEDALILAMAADGADRAAIGRACDPPRPSNSIKGRLMTLARRAERALLLGEEMADA